MYCGRIVPHTSQRTVVVMETVLRVEYAGLVSAGLHVSTSVRISTTVFVTMSYSLPYRTG